MYLQLLRNALDADSASPEAGESTIEFQECADGPITQKSPNGNVQDAQEYLCDHPIIQNTHWKLGNADGQISHRRQEAGQQDNHDLDHIQGRPQYPPGLVPAWGPTDPQ